MKAVERGTGPALVLIPGLQGRWEFMAGTVDALARSFRVITFALRGERASGLSIDPTRGVDNYVAQVAGALDERGIDRALVCGISFGGVVAARFAAVAPDRTAALVLASTPPPVFRLRRRHEIYLRAPWFFGPLFLVEMPFKLHREMTTTFPRWQERWRFAGRQLATLVRAPISFGRMGERGRMLLSSDLVEDCRRITAPTLVVTGEEGLDYVVPTSGTSDYARLIPHARSAVLKDTGHLGSMTRPDAFAAVVVDFVKGADDIARLTPRAGSREQPEREASVDRLRRG